VGVSWVGVLLAVALLAPSAVLVSMPPRDAPPAVRVAPAWTAAERVGQVGALTLLAFAGSGAGRGRGLWLLAATACVAVYWALWARYVLGGRTSGLLVAPLGPVPIPMAVLPVLAFACAAAWVPSWWLGLAAATLAVGHLRVTWASARATDPASRA